MRATASYAYGLLGGARAFARIRPLMYRDTSTRVRTRGIKGVVDGKAAGAADLLVGVLER